jgi:nitrogenase molybdenum-cofactor synthesis protein NifE
MDARVSAKIQSVFEEPACEHNQNKDEKARKKGCTKQLSPGAAAGGCAFDGAKIALQPIADVAHLVHGPIACEGNSWDNRNSSTSGPQLYRTGFTTDIGELDVIYGARSASSSRSAKSSRSTTRRRSSSTRPASPP